MPSTATVAQALRPDPHHRSEPQHRSTEAYVLPRIVDVAPSDPGVVTGLFVREHEHVSRGQPVARVRRAARPNSLSAPVEAIVTSPTAGLVVRCWAGPGEMVRPGGAVLSMTAADEVLVVARFGRAALARLRKGGEALALVGNTGRTVTTARIVSVADLPDDASSYGDGPIRVVLRLPSAPPEALWPGTRAIIELWS